MTAPQRPHANEQAYDAKDDAEEPQQRSAKADPNLTDGNHFVPVLIVDFPQLLDVHPTSTIERLKRREAPAPPVITRIGSVEEEQQLTGPATPPAVVVVFPRCKAADMQGAFHAPPERVIRNPRTLDILVQSPQEAVVRGPK